MFSQPSCSMNTSGGEACSSVSGEHFLPQPPESECAVRFRLQGHQCTPSQAARDGICCADLTLDSAILACSPQGLAQAGCSHQLIARGTPKSRLTANWVRIIESGRTPLSHVFWCCRSTLRSSLPRLGSCLTACSGSRLHYL